jgi:GAF domain-containing protein
MNTQATSEWNIEVERRSAALLERLLLGAVALGLAAMVLFYVSLLKTMRVSERLIAMAPFVVGWLILLILWGWRGIGHRARTLALLVLVYALSVIVLARGGLPGGGRVWLLLPPALAFVLLGPRSGIVAGAISVLTYAFFALAISQQWVVPRAAEDLTAPAPLVAEGVGFLLVAAILTMTWYSFNQSWLEALKEASAASRRLQAQRRESEITNERLRRRTFQLQATAEVAHASSSILDPEQLLTRLVNQIHEGFSPMGVYHVGLFLLDEARRSAVLKAASGEVGQLLLDAGCKLEVDEASTIGWCITHRQARIALGVGEGAAQSDVLPMPHTRSEIALPLRSRGCILGALRLSSTQEVGFNEADIAVLQTMADQAAVAIDNAVRFSQAQAALEELRAVQQRYLSQTWREFLATRPVPRIDHTQPGTEPGDERFLHEARRAAMVHERTVATGGLSPDADGKGPAPQAALVVPLRLRGQVIGTMALHETGRQRLWTAEEITLAETVAEQVALTVENLRLMDETQRRAARERLTGEIMARMRETLDVDTVLQTAVREMYERLNLAEAEVRMGTGPASAEIGDGARRSEA